MLPDEVELPAAADFHVHLRDGIMSEAVVPTIRQGGVDTVYVMPNLVPPITAPAQARAYQDRLRAIDDSVRYLMTLYLHPSITPDVVREAAAAVDDRGNRVVWGIKCYPAGVTTNSAAGVADYEPFYPVFEAMQEAGLVLNLHGECPSDAAAGITVLNAEEKFLPTLKALHARFPRLKIVLEHCTTRAAVEAVEACGENVVGTITAHHLFLTIDDWAGDVFCFCKPVAKLPSDRKALLGALVRSQGKFFLGTDSAPHDFAAKKGPGKTAAGVFTQPYACQLVLTALEEAVARSELSESDIDLEILRGFLGGYGRKFYGVPPSTERIKLRRAQQDIVGSLEKDSVKVVPFRAGERTWGLDWI